MGDGRREGCWAAGVMFRGRVLGRTQIHGRAGQGTALRSGKGWDALCAILCDTGFVPGPFICLKHCRSRHKVTPSRFVCISYFPRKKNEAVMYTGKVEKTRNIVRFQIQSQPHFVFCYY